MECLVWRIVFTMFFLEVEQAANSSNARLALCLHYLSKFAVFEARHDVEQLPKLLLAQDRVGHHGELAGPRRVLHRRTESGGHAGGRPVSRPRSATIPVTIPVIEFYLLSVFQKLFIYFLTVTGPSLTLHRSRPHSRRHIRPVAEDPAGAVCSCSSPRQT